MAIVSGPFAGLVVQYVIQSLSYDLLSFASFKISMQQPNFIRISYFIVCLCMCVYSIVMCALDMLLTNAIYLLTYFMTYQLAVSASDISKSSTAGMLPVSMSTALNAITGQF